MAYKQQRLEARRLYIEDGLEILEISKRLGVNEKSVYRWRQDDAESNDWDKQREEIKMTSFSAARDMLRVATIRMSQMVGEITISGKLHPGDIHALRELINSAKSLQKDVDRLGNVLITVEELTEFLSQRSPDILEQLMPYLSEFGVEMKRKYGKK